MIINNPPSVVLISLYDHHSFGLRNIYGLLRKNGFASNLIFFKELLWNIQEPSEIEINLLVNKIKELNPDVIALSVRSPFFNIAVNLTKRLKPLNKLIIWGNTHPTVEPNECIKHADIICIGDGEKAMLDLMNNLKNEKDISKIKNLWVRKGKKIIKNPLDELNQDLDSVTFYDFSEEHKYSIDENKISLKDPKLEYSKYDIMASRGCPFACAYCSNSYLHKMYNNQKGFLRRRSVEHVIKELVKAKYKLKIKEVFFYDEIFVLDEKWLNKFLKEYKEKINLPFSLCLHPNMVNEEVIRKLKFYGLERVGIGIQSGSERIRKDIFNRNVSDEKLVKVSEIFGKYKIAPTYDIILDNPYETEEDMENAINLLLKIRRPYHLNIFSLTNFPKTDLTERLIKEKKIERNSKEDLFLWKMDINRKREENKQIYNLKVSLFSKTFFPRFIIKNINNKTVLFFASKLSNIIKISFMGIKVIAKGEMNLAMLKYYLRNFRKFNDFQR